MGSGFFGVAQGSAQPGGGWGLGAAPRSQVSGSGRSRGHPARTRVVPGEATWRGRSGGTRRRGAATKARSGVGRRRAGLPLPLERFNGAREPPPALSGCPGGPPNLVPHCLGCGSAGAGDAPTSTRAGSARVAGLALTASRAAAHPTLLLPPLWQTGWCGRASPVLHTRPRSGCLRWPL